MNTNIIITGTVVLKNGFQRGQWVKFFTSSPREDIEREQQECNELNNAALKRGWSEQWREVADHLRSCYKQGIGQNPLPTLRKKFPGSTWVYHKAGSVLEECVEGEIRFTALPQSENETAEVEGVFPGFWSNVWGRWQVGYIPAK